MKKEINLIIGSVFDFIHFNYMILCTILVVAFALPFILIDRLESFFKNRRNIL
jgi:hypothetical protein